MPQSYSISTGRFAAMRVLMVRTGIVLIVPSVPLLVLAMLGIVRVDMLAIGGISGLRTVASIAVLGCLMAAIGYWDDYERN